MTSDLRPLANPYNNIVAPHYKLCILQCFRWSLCKTIPIRRTPCKIGGVLVRNLFRRSPGKLWLGRSRCNGTTGGVVRGVLKLLARSPCKRRRSPCKLERLLKISVFLLQTACHMAIVSSLNCRSVSNTEWLRAAVDHREE